MKRKSYHNEKWHEFSKQVLHRDGYRCLECGRNNTEATLQAHHKTYKQGHEPWEYPLSDCITLCKGCHAREHGIIEPSTGWTLIQIDDLGSANGTCERQGCGHNIRYEHLTYHPKCGYKVVGSTCIEYLTQEDKIVSKDVLDFLSKTSRFVNSPKWEMGVTRNKKSYLEASYSGHLLRIYENGKNFSFQVKLKTDIQYRYDYQKIIFIEGKSLERVKELGFIVLNGMTIKDEKKKELLRNMYRRML